MDSLNLLRKSLSSKLKILYVVECKDLWPYWFSASAHRASGSGPTCALMADQTLRICGVHGHLTLSVGHRAQPQTSAVKRSSSDTHTHYHSFQDASSFIPNPLLFILVQHLARIKDPPPHGSHFTSCFLASFSISPLLFHSFPLIHSLRPSPVCNLPLLLHLSPPTTTSFL